MYQVIVDHKIIDTCDKVNYIKFKEKTKTWIPCKATEAEGIVVKGEKYNIFNKNTFPDRPMAVIVEKETAEVIKNTADTLENTQLEIDFNLECRVSRLELGL